MVFDDIALELTGVVKSGTLTRKADPTYDATAGTYTAAPSEVTCRVLGGLAAPRHQYRCR